MWKIKFAGSAIKTMKKMDRVSLVRINNFLKERIVNCKNPKALAKPLSGSLAGFWRFRVGGWRIIFETQEQELVIMIIEIGHRKEIYRNNPTH